MLATDVYKQVIGQQNFEMGAVVGFVLLMPAVVAFAVDRSDAAPAGGAAVGARRAARGPSRSRAGTARCSRSAAVVGGLILAHAGDGGRGRRSSRCWPYNLALTLKNYAFGDFDSDGWAAYWNSVIAGHVDGGDRHGVVFVGAYLMEKTRGFAWGRGVAQLMAMLPMAVPGPGAGPRLHLLLQRAGNPLGCIYATMTILVVNSVTHFYTVGHLTATTALKQLDSEFEAVSASLKVPLLRTMTRVTVPVCLPAVLDIGIYLFVNAMTTVSAVIFLYSTDTKLARSR